MHISPEEMAAYRAGNRRRMEKDREELSRRYHRAWKIARKGADLLKKEFKAKEVIVFGSLLEKELFHIRSDVDLAVRGLDEKLYYRAVSRLLDLDTDISSDLVMIRDAAESLRKRIEKEGIII